MKTNLSRKYKIIISLSVLLLLVIILKLIGPKEVLPQIIETQPNDNELQASPEIKIIITFDQKITTPGWQASFSPETAFTLLVNENKLEIQPTTFLKEETKYSVSVKNSQFKNFSYMFSFTTLSKSITPPSGGLGDPNFYNEIQKETADKYPLLKYIPFETKNWWVTYRGPLLLKVGLRKDTAEIRQEVLDWIKSKGVNPDTHKIEWKISPNF